MLILNYKEDNMRPLAFSYLRMSTEEQLKGDSLRRQKAASAAYAEEHGLDLIDSLEDVGVSAFRGKNRKKGALKNFLNLVEGKRIPKGSYLLVESLDRLSRERVTEPLGLLLSLISNGITVVTLSDGKKYHDDVEPMDLMYSLIIMMRAHEESEMKSFRVREAWKNKRANMHKKPMTSICPGWLRLNKEEECFEIIQERVEVVQRIFEMSLQGMGRNSIAKVLNEEGISTFSNRGKCWYGATVQKIRHNVAVMGYFPIGGNRLVSELPDESTKDYYPQIIDQDTFYQVQSSVRGRRRQAGNTGRYFANLFQGLAFCYECGAPMRMLSKGRHKAKVYLCSSAHMGSGCTHNVRHKAALIEKKFFDADIPFDHNYFDEGPTSKNELRIQSNNLKQKIMLAGEQVEKLLDSGLNDISIVANKIRSLDDDLKRDKAKLEEVKLLLKKTDSTSPKERAEVTANLYKKLVLVKDDRAKTYALRASINQQLHLSLKKVVFHPNRSVRVYLPNGSAHIFSYIKGRFVYTGDMY